MPQCLNMESKPRPLIRKGMSPTASKPSKIIGDRTSVSGRRSPKSPLLFGQPLLAQITTKGLPLERLTSQCSMSMTDCSLELLPKDNQELDHMTKELITSKKTLMQRLGVKGPFPKVGPQLPNIANLTSPFMHGKSEKKSHLPLSQRILKAPVPWSKTTQWTSNMHSGLCSLQDHSHFSQGLSGSMSSPGRWSTLTSSSLDDFPPSPMTNHYLHQRL
jgi:hypothetical protein